MGGGGGGEWGEWEYQPSIQYGGRCSRILETMTQYACEIDCDNQDQ